jgi:hypothetical protein
VIGALQSPAHLEAIRHRRKASWELGKIQSEPGKIPLDAHQEEIPLGVLMLVGVQDISVVLVEELGNRGDNASTVRTGNEQDGGVLHAGYSIP